MYHPFLVAHDDTISQGKHVKCCLTAHHARRLRTIRKEEEARAADKPADTAAAEPEKPAEKPADKPAEATTPEQKKAADEAAAEAQQKTFFAATRAALAKLDAGRAAAGEPHWDAAVRHLEQAIQCIPEADRVVKPAAPPEEKAAAKVPPQVWPAAISA